MKQRIYLWDVRQQKRILKDSLVFLMMIFVYFDFTMLFNIFNWMPHELRSDSQIISLIFAPINTYYWLFDWDNGSIAILLTLGILILLGAAIWIVVSDYLKYLEMRDEYEHN